MLLNGFCRCHPVCESMASSLLSMAASARFFVTSLLRLAFSALASELTHTHFQRPSSSVG